MSGLVVEQVAMAGPVIVELREVLVCAVVVVVEAAVDVEAEVAVEGDDILNPDPRVFHYIKWIGSHQPCTSCKTLPDSLRI